MIRLLALAYLSLFLLGLTDNIRGPVFPEILHEFSLSDTTGSLFFSLSSFCGFVGGLLSPRLIERFGQMGSLRWTFVLCGSAMLVFSWAPHFYWMLFAVLFFGFGLGVMGVIQNTLVVTQSPPHLRQRLLSGLHSMYALASLLAPLSVGAVAHFFPGQNIWRLSFQWGAVFCGAVLLISFLAGREGASVSHRVSSPKPLEGSHQQYYFAMMVACYVLVEVLVSSRLSLYMNRRFHADTSEASLATAGFFVALLAGRALFAFWTPKIPLKLQLLFSLLFTAISLVVGLAIHPLGLMLSGLFMGPFYPLIMMEAARLFPHHLSEAVAKAVGFGSFFVVGMHLAFGWISDHFGILTAFSLGPLFCLVSFAMLALHEKVFYRLQP